ncbi:hypothetical protein G6F63_015144 [Rhizopus arrhizus]|nr:hypothetical protein G6F63_015144 [Rhizopus arrhizus]
MPAVAVAGAVASAAAGAGLQARPDQPLDFGTISHTPWRGRTRWRGIAHGALSMTETPQTETLGFQTEVKQLLQLMIHSLYSNKEIFLRELGSNAADAADKLRFEALTQPALLEGDSELRVRGSFDPAAHTITIEDNGIGMSRAEAIAHLGTILAVAYLLRWPR